MKGDTKCLAGILIIQKKVSPRVHGSDYLFEFMLHYPTYFENLFHPNILHDRLESCDENLRIIQDP